ncbi:MAG: LptF/LptG family permease [Verrucomicrobiota bacterium]
MRTLHTYLTRQVLATTMMTVAVFTFVLLLGNVLREIFTILLNDRASIKVIGMAIGLLLPHVFVFSLPMGMLTAMLLTFGRLSAERELIAIRNGGISLLALITPMLLLAAAFSCVCALVNMEIGPRCRFVYKNLIYDLGNKRPDAVLSEKCFIRDIPGFIIYVDQIKGNDLHHLLISKLNTNSEIVVNLRAERGQLVRQPGTNQFVLHLYNSSGAALENGNWQPLPFLGESEYVIALPSVSTRKPKLNEMTFGQLREELRQIEAAQMQTGSLAGMDAQGIRRKMAESRLPMVDVTTPILVEMHRQVAFSFACIGFTLVGIPLGIRSHRKETSVGMAVALVLVLVYYSFLIMAGSLDTNAKVYPYLICWIPNFLFQVVGAWLLWRANRN